VKQSHRTSIFNIKIDLALSHGSYLYDLNTNRKVLDLFGMYSSLPLGYNHPAFDGLATTMAPYLSTKIANCEMDTVASEQFIEEFFCRGVEVVLCSDVCVLVAGSC
jgi:4-aminobutyrate aminotransferase-like enzyme